MEPDSKPISNSRWLPLTVFLLVRVSILLALPFEGLRGYGDLPHFFNLASLPGLPYLNYWAEFPPVFPFLSELLLALGGQEHVYTYLLVLLFSAANLGSLLIFLRLTERVDAQPAAWRGVVYAALLGGLAYNWWYFDSLAVFFCLLGLEWSLSRRPTWLAGGALGLGILTKLFPALLLPALWRWLPRRRAVLITAWAGLLAVAVYGGLWLAAPDFTRASLQSQSAKGSWETVWALIDGNLRTGNFGPEIERLNPAAAAQAVGNPPRLNPWASLGVFGAAGLLLFSRFKPASLRQGVSFAGLTWVIFLLWSPGWSPQWVLYLLPLILLTLPERLGLLLAGSLVLANLLEWPLMLSRGYFQFLPLTILLRTLLLVLLGWVWWGESHSQAASTPSNTYPHRR
jgi:hypothetical protein